MIKHIICLDVESYYYYEVSDEFSRVIVKDHSKVKCYKDRVWVMVSI